MKLPYDKLVKVARKETTIRQLDIALVYDIFLFFMRKWIVENRKCVIRGFGTFYIKKYKRKGDVVKFSASRYLIHCVNKNIELTQEFWRFGNQGKITPLLRDVSKIFKTKIADIASMFQFFLYGIAKGLIEDEIVKLKFFGTFKLFEMKFKKNNVCGDKNRKIINVKKVIFKMKPIFYREMLKVESHFCVSKRAQKILEMNKVSTKI